MSNGGLRLRDPPFAYGALFRQRRFIAAGWSSPVARQAHNLKVAGSNPAPATIFTNRANFAGEAC
jgi:hypothetical protein